MSQQNTLETWMAEEADVRARLDAGPGPGVAPYEQIVGMTGLETMQAIPARRASLRADLAHAGLHIVGVRAGQAVFQGTPLPAHLNPLGTIHGGWVATLLDSALGCSIHTMMPPGHGYTTPSWA